MTGPRSHGSFCDQDLSIMLPETALLTGVGFHIRHVVNIKPSSHALSVTF